MEHYRVMIAQSGKEVIVLRVLQDRQNWQYIIGQWIKSTKML